jgi:hypothetical protein
MRKPKPTEDVMEWILSRHKVLDEPDKYYDKTTKYGKMWIFISIESGRERGVHN